MTARTKSTVHLLCIQSGIMNKEIPKEAQKLLDLYNDPDVALEQKVIVRGELDDAIRKLEERVTTRQIREQSGGLQVGP